MIPTSRWGRTAIRFGLVLWICSLLWLLPEAGAASRALVLLDPRGGERSEQGEELSRELKQAGYEVAPLTFDELCAPATELRKQCDLLLVADATALPRETGPTIERFLQGGGHLIALGLPAWSNPLRKSQDRWLSQDEARRALADQRPQHDLLHAASPWRGSWRHAACDATAQGSFELIADGDAPAMVHAIIERLDGWDTWSSPELSEPLPAGHTLTCFRAKGTAATRHLAVEWIEQDGCRWIATVALTPQWQWYVLTPEDFRVWMPPAGRGSPQDRLQVERARRLVLGLAESHTPLPEGRYEYWVDQLGTAANPLGAAPPAASSVPLLEGLSPNFLFYPIGDRVRLETPALQGLVTAATPTAPTRLIALHPRPRGVGFDQQRPWRWQPLLTARAANGDHRGNVAALVVHLQPPYRGAAVAAFTADEPEFYRHEGTRQMLREVALRLRKGLWLAEAGSEFFTVFPQQSFRVGAQVVQFGAAPTPGTILRLTVSDSHDSQDHRRVLVRQEWPVDLKPGTQQTYVQTLQENDWPDRPLHVAVELLQQDEIIDRLTHELHVWRPTTREHAVQIRGGEFVIDGQPWKAHGINYMPSSGIGLGSGPYFEHWLGRGAYDPEVIQRDLQRIQQLGFNSVSVFVYHQSLPAQHLLDFLLRCRQLGLRVNQSLRPGTPMEFRWQEMRQLIEYYRLAENETIMAYDLAWEPSHFDHRHQQRYAPAWAEWLTAKYGGLEQAEAAWGVAAPRDNGGLSVPPMEQLIQDGPWRKLAADYRRFLDELVGRQYREARRLVRTIDDWHPVSFRMQHAGDPTHLTDRLLPYDFAGLIEAVDIWEPEAYGRIGPWERVRAGHFTAAYARLCDPNKPVVWAEAGYNIWDPQQQRADAQRMEDAAAFYRDFYRLLIESGADGVFYWWYPGGLRVNENSDFGILNPDGTDRPVTQVIREHGPRFLAAPKPPAPDVWLEVDRDADARGLPGVYEALAEPYWQAIANGHSPSLRWKPDTEPPVSRSAPGDPQ